MHESGRNGGLPREGLRLIYKSDKCVCKCGWVCFCVRWSRAGCSVISSLWLHSTVACARSALHSLCTSVCVWASERV